MDHAAVALWVDAHHRTRLESAVRLEECDQLVELDDELADVLVDPRVHLAAWRKSEDGVDVAGIFACVTLSLRIICCIYSCMAIGPSMLEKLCGSLGYHASLTSSTYQQLWCQSCSS